ncbi:MAG: SusD/RagB family nutrient-binding outer membrane lipoprotein [Tannerellaceae bacterium]|jgi:hypothetical protein|nr:SusD/RagB family nutrient-binding outer membrane lipoprotein [Tannerellaceae bacterium]
MKKNFIIQLSVLLWTAISFSSCDLDINVNPNFATGSVVTPDLILPGSIAALAEDINTYNKFGALMVGYQFPGDGLSGFGDLYSYNYTSASDTGLWNNAYAHLRDIQDIITVSDENPYYIYFGAAAHVIRAYTYHLLVDEYGNVPYFEGIRGDANIAPAFDDDAAVYQAIIEELSDAVATFQAAEASSDIPLAFSRVTDPLFGGNIVKWIQFANNLKLRLLLRAAGTEIDGFVQSAFNSFSAEGFLKEDALINPGYNASSKQNPFYNDYHSSVTGAISQYAHYYLPTTYLLTFYLGTKLQDDRRGALLYRDYPATPHYQLGKQDEGRPYTPGYIWLESVLKGREQGFGAFYAFETYFLLAEAAATGHELDGDWKTNFEKGIAASFRYLESTASGSLVADADPEADAKAYIEANAGSYLANPDLATTPAQQLEAIITQKYIASNPINAHEAWNDFRRTAYPVINNAGRQPELTFASYLSDSPREDKMLVRHVYPQAEYDLNANTPDVGNSFSNPIFWDKN